MKHNNNINNNLIIHRLSLFYRYYYRYNFKFFLGNYLDARNRAKRGENTSNLSDNVDESVKKQRKFKTFISNKKDACLWDSTSEYQYST